MLCMHGFPSLPADELFSEKATVVKGSGAAVCVCLLQARDNQEWAPK